MNDSLGTSKRVGFAGIQVSVGIDGRYARRLRHLLPYRAVTRPALRIARRVVGRPSGAPSDHGEVSFSDGDRAWQRRIDAAVAATPEARAIAERVNALEWYHVLDLPHGVSTPGHADHRGQIHHYGLPADMRGMRALDVATFDGFWAFEMERRGAEVVAVDIGRWSQADIPQRWLERMTAEDDAPTGASFRLAKELLGSQVDRRERSVYDLTPDDLGTFDVVFMSDLLLHLRDPQRALERLFPLTKKDGYALIAETYNPDLDRLTDLPISQFVAFSRFIWQVPSATALHLMVKVAGFDATELSRFQLCYDHPHPIHKLVLKAYPYDRE